MVNQRPWRWLTVWVSPEFAAIAAYRLDRGGFLACGPAWALLRLFLIPLFVILRMLGANSEIHYRANIGEGFQILHAALGIVISGEVIIGRRLLLTGGNCIGLRGRPEGRPFTIGDNVSLGANAVIVGPGHIGGGSRIGAGAVVIGDVASGSTMIGVPARSVS